MSKLSKIIALGALAVGMLSSQAYAYPGYGYHGYHGGYGHGYGGYGSRSVFIVGIGPTTAYYPPVYAAPVYPAYPAAVYAPPPPVVQAPPVDQRYCREYQSTATIGGHVQKSYGTACRQPDGSWQIIN